MNGLPSNPVRNLLGPALRRARMAGPAKLRQSDLAARLQLMGLNLDRSIISRIENQQRHLTDIEFLAFLEALRIDFDRMVEFFPDQQLPAVTRNRIAYPNPTEQQTLVAEDQSDDPS